MASLSQLDPEEFIQGVTKVQKGPRNNNLGSSTISKEIMPDVHHTQVTFVQQR